MDICTVHLAKIENGLPVRACWVCPEHASEARHGEWVRVEDVA